MTAKLVREPKLRLYTEDQRTFLQLPTARVKAVRDHLRNHGVIAGHPQPVILGIHSLELPAKSDLKAVQILLNECKKT